MKRFRLLLISLAAVAGLAAVAVAVVFSSAFQTWAARKALAGRPGPAVSLGTVSAGLQRVQLGAVRVEQDGLVLTIPQVEVELPLISAALKGQVSVARLVAKGWTIDLSKYAAAAKTSAPAAAAQTAGAAFAGVFSQLRLPVDLQLDDVALEGEVILPEGRGRTRVVLTGGGLGVGREGKFQVTGDAQLADPAVNRLQLKGALHAAMDTPRTFNRLGGKIDVAASGAQFPQGVKLTAEVSADRNANGEGYAAAVESGGRSLLKAKADFPQAAKQLTGTWQVDLSDTDVAPFALGQPLPSFAAVGEGKFEADATFAAVQTKGRLSVRADRLTAVRAELAGLGAVQVVTDFDVARRGTAVAVERLEVSVAGAAPIATLRTMQPFSLDPQSRELRAADANRELFLIVLQGVPLAWAKPMLKGVTVSGGDLRGEWLAMARSGGLSLRSKAPLSVEGLTIVEGTKTLLKGVDVVAAVHADYAPQGWQAEVSSLTAKSGGAVLVNLEAKAGQLAGAGQALKATGKLTAQLPAVLAQPAAQGLLLLKQGEMTADFVANLAATQEIQARVQVRNLAVDSKVSTEKLPTVSADLRADLAPTGQISVNAPLILERNGRRSDLTLAGTVTPMKTGMTVDAQATSANFTVDDAAILAVLLPAPPPTTATAAATPATVNRPPPWAGFDGAIKLALKKVVYSEQLQATDVAGTVRLEGGALKFEKVGLNLGEGSIRVDGAVTYDPKAKEAYALAADVAVKDFDPAPLFKALNPKLPPTVEGKFNANAKITAQSKSLAELAETAGGEFQLMSPGGVFRGLPVSAGNAVDTTGKVASWIATAGTAIGALTGKKEYTDVANKAQALAELTNFLRAITYDQFNLVTHRDRTSLNATLKDVSLIAPEIRLTGSGVTTHQPGRPVLEDTIAMEFKLRARGRVAELLKYLGVLDPQVDDLGYSACTLPLKVGGTVGKPDTSELNSRLASLALEKSGVAEKAGDLFNKLLGGGK